MPHGLSTPLAKETADWLRSVANRTAARAWKSGHDLFLDQATIPSKFVLFECHLRRVQPLAARASASGGPRLVKRRRPKLLHEVDSLLP